MNRFVLILIFCLVLFFGTIDNAGAYFAVVTTDPGTRQTTSELTAFSTAGDDMVGMSVTATFHDDTIETLYWSSYGTDKGRVLSSGKWKLSVDSSSTFDTDIWRLRIYSGIFIKTLFLDAGLGDAVFDIVHEDPLVEPTDTDPGNEGSFGSRNGKPFGYEHDGIYPPGHEKEDEHHTHVNITYSGEVSIGGADPVGDLYRYMTMDFSNYNGGDGLGNDTTRYFSSDTDNLLLTGDIQPVPEPSLELLLSICLVGFAGIGVMRKIKQKKVTNS